MNNVEALEDFLKTLKEIHPNITISQRDEMMLGMAINHAFLVKKEEIGELRSRIIQLESELEGYTG